MLNSTGVRSANESDASLGLHWRINNSSSEFSNWSRQSTNLLINLQAIIFAGTLYSELTCLTVNID